MILIFSYTPSCAGMGDFLRAAGYMYDICKKKNIDFYLDITNPIHHFFTYEKYTGDTSGFTHITFRNPDPAAVTVFVDRLPTTENIIYKSNYTAIYNDTTYVNRLSAILRPTTNILEQFHKQLQTLALHSGGYSCIHIRFGDIMLRGAVAAWDNRAGDDLIVLNNRITKAFELRKHSAAQTLVISDNYTAKVELSKEYGCPLLDIKPVHTSFTSDIDAVRDTVLEFLVLSHASEVLIVTTSGFPYWAAAYGGVPNTEVWRLKM